MAKKRMVMLSTLLLVACLPAAARAAEPAPGEHVGATTSPERPPVREQYAAPEEPPCPRYGSPPGAWQEEDAPPGAAGVAPTVEADPGARYDDNAQGAQYGPDAPYPSDQGTYEDPCSGDNNLDQAAAVEPAAEDARTADDALAEAHEAARRPVEAQAAEPTATPAPSARTAEVDPGAQNDPATPYPSDGAEPAARDAQDTEAALDGAPQITQSDPPSAVPAGPTVLDAGGTQRVPERVREGSGGQAEYVVREPVSHAPQPPVGLPFATAGGTDAGAPAPKEPLVPAISPSGPEDGPEGGEDGQYAAPAQEVSPKEAGPRTEESAARPEAQPIASREAAPESPQKAAEALSAVPLSATGGSLLLALGAGALIYRRLGR